MILSNQLFMQIENHIESVLLGSDSLGIDLWNQMLREHPADIASLLIRLSDSDQKQFLEKLPLSLSVEVFEKLSIDIQSDLLVRLDSEHATSILQHMPAYKIADLLEEFSDEDFKKYLGFLQKKLRSKVLSLLSFEPDSAGGIMNSDILTFFEDLTIKNAIRILQRLAPKKEHLHETIFITSKENILVGHIHVKELLLNKPEATLKELMHINELLITADQDQEFVANQMQHYGLPIAPVVDNQNQFLGIVTADEIFDIIKEEASEDLYKISGITPIEYSYFHTPFWELVWQRSPWLISLLILQSVSSIIMNKYQAILDANIILSFFLTMLIGTGGNAGNQSGAVVVRGLATGEIGRKNGIRVLLREFKIAIVMAAILAALGFLRVFVTPQADIIKAFAISLSLFVIVIVSMMVGTALPLFLERFNFDPAHSAAPFLSTLMDIIGIFIYCLICSNILG